MADPEQTGQSATAPTAAAASSAPAAPVAAPTPAAPSAPDAAPPPAAPAAVSANAPQEPKARAERSFFERLFRFGRAEENEPADEPAVSESASEEQAAGTQSVSGTLAQDAPAQTQTKAEQLAAALEAMSDEELREMVNRAPERAAVAMGQREADRREARRLREEHDRQRAAAEARERELRQTDPYEAAELRNALDEQREAEERAAREEAEREAATQEQRTRLGDLITHTGRTYDQATITPLLEALPEAERTRLEKAAKNGLDGRTELVKEAVSLLLKAARDEGARAAEKRLRSSDPFRKQVLLDEREEEDEPVLVTSGTSRGAEPFDMNDLLRAAAGRARGGGGNINPFRITESD